MTGESRIVYANADENPDLYQVLKGMGSNFGKLPNLLIRSSETACRSIGVIG